MEKIDYNFNTLILGDRQVLLGNFKEKIEKEIGQENIIYFEIEKLNISVDDVRRMIQFVNRKSEQKKVVLLSSFYWSDEVQNAMLKVLEESRENTSIFLFANSKKFFLPTVLSRVQTIEDKESNKYLKMAKEVLELEPNERLENKQIKKILALKVTDTNFTLNTENEKKDREAHVLFIDAIINTLLDNKSQINLSKGYLEKLLKITTIYDIEGGSPSLFIEWLLLTSPKIN